MEEAEVLAELKDILISSGIENCDEEKLEVFTKALVSYCNRKDIDVSNYISENRDVAIITLGAMWGAGKSKK